MWGNFYGWVTIIYPPPHTSGAIWLDQHLEATPPMDFDAGASVPFTPDTSSAGRVETPEPPQAPAKADAPQTQTPAARDTFDASGADKSMREKIDGRRHPRRRPD